MNKRVLSILIASALLVSAVPSYAENSGASGEDMQYEDIQYAEDTDIEYEDDTAQLFAELYETTEDGAFEFSIAGETAKITKYTGSDAIVEMPAVITFNDVGYSVTEIGDYAFSGNSSVVKITVPEGVKKLGRDVFSYCANLQSVTLPEGIEEAGYDLFRECKSLTEATVPSTLKTIDNSMFYNCSSLKTVNLQEGLQQINDAAFRGCSSLKKLEIPASVTSLGSWVIQSCSGLEFVYFKGEAPAVNGSTFDGFSEDTAFYCNHSMADTFTDDIRYKDIYSKVKIKDIDDYFQVDENGVLTGINTASENVRKKMLIPDKFLDIEITKIGAGAFDAAEGTEIIEIPESVTEIEAEFPAGVKSIYFACSCPEVLPVIPEDISVYVATKYKETFAEKIDNVQGYDYSMFYKVETEDGISITGYQGDRRK